MLAFVAAGLYHVPQEGLWGSERQGPDAVTKVRPVSSTTSHSQCMAKLLLKGAMRWC